MASMASSFVCCSLQVVAKLLQEVLSIQNISSLFLPLITPSKISLSSSKRVYSCGFIFISLLQSAIAGQSDHHVERAFLFQHLTP
jgi:hypothetical protein